MTTVPRLLSLAEVAQVLGISPRTLRVLVARKLLPTIRLTARRVLVSEDDLRAFVASRRTTC